MLVRGELKAVLKVEHVLAKVIVKKSQEVSTCANVDFMDLMDILDT